MAAKECTKRKEGTADILVRRNQGHSAKRTGMSALRHRFLTLNPQLFAHRSDPIEQRAIGAEEVEEIGLKWRGRRIGEDGRPNRASRAKVPTPLQELPGCDAALPIQAEALGFAHDADKAQYG